MSTNDGTSVLDPRALSKLSDQDYANIGIPFCNICDASGKYYYSSDLSLPLKYTNLNYMLYIGIGSLVCSLLIIVLTFILLSKSKTISVGLSGLLICCICAISGSNFYQYYNTNKAINNLSNDPNNKPCLDPTGLIIYYDSDDNLVNANSSTNV